jgi:hypothetical protein
VRGLVNDRCQLLPMWRFFADLKHADSAIALFKERAWLFSIPRAKEKNR